MIQTSADWSDKEIVLRSEYTIPFLKHLRDRYLSDPAYSRQDIKLIRKHRLHSARLLVNIDIMVDTLSKYEVAGRMKKYISYEHKQCLNEINAAIENYKTTITIALLST